MSNSLLGIILDLPYTVKRFAQNSANASLYTFSKVGCWIALIIVLLSALGVTLGELGLKITQITILVQDPQNSVFGTSLDIILSIMSLVFVLIIFLIQNANQEYSSRLSSTIYHDRYFLFAVLFILVASLFNISGSYFEWGTPLTAIGYAFSISTILLVLALIAFAGHFIDISNIIDYTTKQIKRRISSDRIYQASSNALFSIEIPDEEFGDQLFTQVQLLTSTCIRGIEENNRVVVKTCLDSIIEIVDKYLKETNSKEVSDDFFDQLNDEFKFISSTAFDDYSRQKYAESIVEAIGDIGIALTKNREMGTPGTRWSDLLSSLFIDALEFDRNATAPKSIDKLKEMSITSIRNGDFESQRVYLGDLEEISSICVTGTDQYLSGLYLKVSRAYQDSYIAFVSALCSDSHLSQYDVEQLLNEYSNSFTEAQSNFSRYNQQGLYASIVGPYQPFLGKLGSELSHYQDLNPRTEQELVEYLSKLVDFFGDISSNPDEAHRNLFNAYSQLVYVLWGYSPLSEDKQSALIKATQSDFIDLTREVYYACTSSEDNVENEVNKRIADHYAILIYLYKDQPDLLSDFVTPIAELYDDIKSDQPGSQQTTEWNLDRLYGHLKLIGAWIDYQNDLEDVCPELQNHLVDDYAEPESHGKAIVSKMRQLDYPNNRMGINQGWYINPSNVWGNQFQEEVSQNLTGDVSIYEDFHEKIQSLSHKNS